MLDKLSDKSWNRLKVLINSLTLLIVVVGIIAVLGFSLFANRLFPIKTYPLSINITGIINSTDNLSDNYIAQLKLVCIKYCIDKSYQWENYETKDCYNACNLINNGDNQ